MRALITGGHGFAGRYLARHLAECGDDVIITQTPASLAAKEPTPEESIKVPRSVQCVALDVTNSRAVRELIQVLAPDVVYHLAAKTFVPEAEKRLDDVFAVNASGSVNVFEAVVEHAPRARVLFVSSSEVYGNPRPSALPLSESAELRPISSYGLTKAFADLAAYKFAFRSGVDIVRARPFSHTGPGQSPRFALSSFAKQVAEIRLGKKAPRIEVGNLEAKRDYSDVSDIVRGYREALLNGKRGAVYNLCSGQSVQIGDFLHRLIEIAEVDVEIVVDQERVRPVEVPDVFGTSQRAQKEFGWRPRIEVDAMLHSLFAFWLEHLGSE